MVTAATLGGSWGAVPIRDIKDLPGKRVGKYSEAPLFGASRAPMSLKLLPSLFWPLSLTHSDTGTWLSQVTDSRESPSFFSPGPCNPI